jgi:uncharacterized membrane protein HdeD (DUF308 family)/alpha-beta hydrolase superfamily lysophospholipase
MTVSIVMRRRIPRWLSLVVGIASVVIGAVLTLRPFTSLSVLVALVAAILILTGTSDFIEADASPFPRLAQIAGAAWIVVGIVVLAWPGITVSVLAFLVGLSMLGGGILKILDGVRDRTDHRVLAIVSGIASLIFGVLALSWPDATVLVIAIVFGARTVLFGFSQIGHALRREPTGGAAHQPGPVRRGARLVRPIIALVVALALLSLSALLHRDSPVVTAFYDTPNHLPAQPGVLLRSEPMTQGVPSDARAERILYTTTKLDGTIVAASGTVVLANSAETKRPVLLWTHGTTGVARQCAPSLAAKPFAQVPALDQVMHNGWVVVAPDYPGLGTVGAEPYLIGIPEAESSLDAVRAARQLPGLNLGPQTIVWGHSQGGGSALWVGIEAKHYAPDVPLTAVAAFAPASDLTGLASVLQKSALGMLFGSYVVNAYSQTYSDVSFDHYVRATARPIVDEALARCATEKTTIVSVAELLSGQSVFDASPASGALAVRLKENIPSAPSSLPTFIGQGLADTIILPPVQDSFVKELCGEGQTVEYKTYAGRGHLTVVAEGSPLLPDVLAWTQDRFAGKPAPSTCATH